MFICCSPGPCPTSCLNICCYHQASKLDAFKLGGMVDSHHPGRYLGTWAPVPRTSMLTVTVLLLVMALEALEASVARSASFGLHFLSFTAKCVPTISLGLTASSHCHITCSLSLVGENTLTRNRPDHNKTSKHSTYKLS